MYDLIIKNATTIDNQPISVAVTNGKIEKVAQEIHDEAREIFDANGLFLSAGWIDAHVHCFEKMDLYYDYPDKVGVENGVTTIVDAGSTGENNIRDFYEIAKNAKTNVYALLNISKNGIVTQDELSDLSRVNETKNIERINELPEFIIGIKARMSKSVIGENGVKPLVMAKELQKKVNLPLMVHIGTAPVALDELFTYLEKGDIVTHCFNGKDNGILDTNGKIKEFAKTAYHNGVHFDIGHGTDSFNFEVALRAKEEDILADTISTDIYSRNREYGPVYNMATTMEKLMFVGYSLEEVVTRVTKAPAKALGFTTKGEVKEGFDADFTLFEVANEAKELRDSNGATKEVNQKIIPKTAIIAGKVYNI
ncbi:dihydroorotase [Pilibacter termitis]|uniref:Dihydroorotase n=1 Tax=Pilibacter termitis TaxID=263852 RepID=A0A1T4NX26_9ENTE|nr:amidohydrolase/deacetylase family metallohydrolase [Pilibacter termitis]SJZ83765.1 dihydroorotase [Pilibacter termitis]